MNVLAFIRQRSFARFVAVDLAEAARRLDWQVHWLDLDGERQRLAGLAPTERPAATRALRARLQGLAPDLVFSYGLEAFAPAVADLVPDETWAIADLASAAIACFLFDFGYPFETPGDPAVVPLLTRLRAPDVRLWCWDAAAGRDLAALGIAADPFPMAVNERMFFPPAASPVSPRPLPIVFSGGPTPERVAVLERVAPLGLTLYGYDADAWEAAPALRAAHRGLVAERHEMRALYHRARLTINVTRAHGRASLNMRVFEAMACGCLVLTDQAEAAASLFEPGRHLVTYASPDELDALARHYLAHEDERRRIAEAGSQAVLRHHTYTARLASIADALRALVVEGRAWRHFLSYLADDPAKATRFLEALRAAGHVRRVEPWRAALGGVTRAADRP